MRENGGRLDFGFISSSDWATCYHLLCCSSWKKWCLVCCSDQFILFVNSRFTTCFLFFHIRAFSFVFDTCVHHVSYIGSFGCYMPGAMWNCCHLTHSSCFVYTMIHHVPVYSVVWSCIWSFSECWVIFLIPIIHKTLTWITGCLTWVWDLFTHGGTLVYCLIQRNLWSLTGFWLRKNFGMQAKPNRYKQSLTGNRPTPVVRTFK